MLSILSGHKRYAHVAAMRCDGVNPGLLGCAKVISEDALRRAQARIPEAQGGPGSTDTSPRAWRRCCTRPVGRLFRESSWLPAGQGREGKDGELQLTGWESKRRVVVLRGRLAGEIVLTGEADGQQVLAFVEANRQAGKAITGYEYAVLVTNTEYAVLSLGQLYRDRADAENAFDELKNQWGWGGFTTHDLHRCQRASRAVARVYNWWSLFVRLANPQARREAITSRPWLMTAVGRRTEHAGQTTLTLTGLHTEFDKARAALMRVFALLQQWVTTAAE